jgi:phospholipid/cholesterol/gamma-HCH transport system substrate-binding protein
VNYKSLYVTVPQTGNLIAHDPVRIAGVQVGQISGIAVRENGDARIALQIDPGTKLLRGTTFGLRANGLLGSRFVQLIPGHGPGQLPNGSTLHGGFDSLTYGVPDALAVFNQRTRGSLGDMVNGLGRGLLGRGRGLGQTIGEIAAESGDAQSLVAGLIGPGHLQRLVPSLESLMVPLDQARGDITALLSPASASFQPFVDRRSAVQSALDQAPPALAAANAGLSNGQRLLSAADTLAVTAHEILPTVPAGLRATTALLANSHPALARTKALLETAKPAVPAVLRITSSLSPVLPPLSQALSRGTPIADQVAPYGCNITNFAAVIRSMTGFGAADQPGGPGGPAMAFRLEVLPAAPTEVLGTADVTHLVKRVGYLPPCHYLATTYPTNLDPTAGLDGQN